jgi:nicotinate phosphoribosyltransferase
MPSALRAFDETAPADVPRVALIDTFHDEKFAALEAAQTLGQKLAAVRLDTPGSRKGNFAALLCEVRWELDLRGYQHVKLFVSGGLDEDEIRELRPVVDGYGVGTAISNAPVINLALDIVEIEGRPMAKRGKLSGAKLPMRCGNGHHWITPEARPCPCPDCAATGTTEMAPLTRAGKLVAELPSPQAIRQRVLAMLARLADG